MKVKLENVGVIKNCDVEFTPGINLIVGSSGSGKSTLVRSIYNIACNNFADSDITFDKNTMNITVESNNNTIEYNRSIRQRSSACYYKVNGEKYVKLGRQALPAVTNVLKLNNICINGDDINFNFNLQFSTPFLIMGSQSTLYNVLTYRSTCDITSINEYYENDVKANASEICSTIKLKEQLNDNLESLKSDAKKLASIEDVYSDFILYKHELEQLNNLKSYTDKLDNTNILNDKLAKICKVINLIEIAMHDLSLLIDVNYYNSVKNAYNVYCNTVEQCNEFIIKYNELNNTYETLLSLNKLLNVVSENTIIDDKYSKLVSMIKLSHSLLINEQFINDISKLQVLYILADECSTKQNILNKLNNNAIYIINDLIIANKKLSDINKIDNTLSIINDKNDTIMNNLNNFKVCPLCGKHLMQND